MSPLFRGILVLAVALIGSIVIVISDRHRVDFNYLMALSIAFPFIDLSFSVSQLAITPYLLISLVYIALRIRRVSWFVTRVPILILIGIMVATTIFSQYKLVSVLSACQRLLLLIPAVASYSLFLNRNVSNTLYILILPPIFYTLLFALIQIFINPYFSFYYSIWQKEARLSCCYMDPQIAGCAIATFLILLFNFFLKTKKLTHIVLIVLLFIVGCFTGSKTFLLGVSLAFVLSLIRHIFSTNFFSARDFIIVIFFIFALLSACIILSESPVFQRMTEMNESLNGRRDVYWLGAWKIYLENPIFGIGPGSFQSYAEKYDLPMRHWMINGEFIYASQPESGYLLWLDEYGIFSLVLMALLIYVFSRKGVTSLNYCALIPWAVCFGSLYNIKYTHISVLLTIIIGALFAVHKRILLCSNRKTYK